MFAARSGASLPTCLLRAVHVLGVVIQELIWPSSPLSVPDDVFFVHAACAPAIMKMVDFDVTSYSVCSKPRGEPARRGHAGLKMKGFAFFVVGMSCVFGMGVFSFSGPFNRYSTLLVVVGVPTPLWDRLISFRASRPLFYGAKLAFRSCQDSERDRRKCSRPKISCQDP